MNRVIIIGCGIIGAAIAYELSKLPDLEITVLDRQPPAQGATGASLGVLMGAISQKVKGRTWQLREASIQRYQTLIPEVEAIVGRKIPVNQQGILILCLAEDNLADWEQLQAIRQSQGWPLEIWDVEKVRDRCPHLDLTHIKAGIYSPQDRQLDPTALTLALVDAAKIQGVNFKFDVTVEEIQDRNHQLVTTMGVLEYDRLVIAAGLGSAPLTTSCDRPLDIRPVLGQAVQFRFKDPLGNPDFQPAISCDDVHLVPVGPQDYWVGATVEFPNPDSEPIVDDRQLEDLIEKAIAFCPALAQASRVRQWSGQRPRPQGRPAPIIEILPGSDRILVATGHYRNGILLAPVTAQKIREMLVAL